jgi:hypothetical protein
MLADMGRRQQTHRWRRRRDSNPRYALTAYNGLANRRLQPLGHVSSSVNQALITPYPQNKPEIVTGLSPEPADHVRPRIAASMALAAA